jgi:hypothetical protein
MWLKTSGQEFKRYITQSELEALHGDCAIWEGPSKGGEKREEPNEAKSELGTADSETNPSSEVQTS